MKSFEQRVIDEKNDLDDKIEKLSVFIMTSGTFIILDNDEQENLKLQLNIMSSYSLVLNNRMRNMGLL